MCGICANTQSIGGAILAGLPLRFAVRTDARTESDVLVEFYHGAKGEGWATRNLMRQIGRGRSPSLRTEDRILAFIGA